MKVTASRQEEIPVRGEQREGLPYTEDQRYFRFVLCQERGAISGFIRPPTVHVDGRVQGAMTSRSVVCSVNHHRLDCTSLPSTSFLARRRRPVSVILCVSQHLSSPSVCLWRRIFEFCRPPFVVGLVEREIDNTEQMRPRRDRLSNDITSDVQQTLHPLLFEEVTRGGGQGLVSSNCGRVSAQKKTTHPCPLATNEPGRSAVSRSYSLLPRHSLKPGSSVQRRAKRTLSSRPVSPNIASVCRGKHSRLFALLPPFFSLPPASPLRHPTSVRLFLFFLSLRPVLTFIVAWDPCVIAFRAFFASNAHRKSA